jgi:hypothetical protein
MRVSARARSIFCIGQQSLVYVNKGLVLCFSHRSAKIEPVLATPILAGTGGGWIDMGLVIMDRF